MKILSQILATVLVVQLLVATSSIPLVYHFCGDEVESVSVGVAKQCDCQHNDQDEDDSCAKDCCRNELHISEFHPDALLSAPIVPPTSLFAALHIVLPFSSPASAYEKHPVCTIAFDTHPPARSSDIPILFRSLLI